MNEITLEPQTSASDAPERPTLAARLAGWMRANRLLVAALALLILSRTLLIHGDLTDFPLDRNVTAGNNIARFLRYTTLYQLHTEWSKYVPMLKLMVRQKETPEFPFIPLAARLLVDLRVPPLVAARFFSMLMALWTGVGIYILGRRLHSREAGLAALWIFALDPFSIFMGRSLLPDTPMVAAVTWSMVAAGAPTGSAWGRWLRTTFWLTVAALAKLPAIFFAPAAAALLMQRLGWRRKGAWIMLAVSALAVYLIVYLWYWLPFGVPPWDPVTGMQRISEGTNNLMSSLGDLSGTPWLWVSAMRLVLALTLPGLFLALLGWIVMQRQADRIAFNVWAALVLLFVPITLRANTYWVYSAVPLGCLLGGVALPELLRLYPGAPKPLLAVLLLLLWTGPSRDKIREYLVTHPEYNAIGSAAEKVMGANENEKAYYLGKISGDLQYFVRHNGDITRSKEVLSEIKRTDYPFLVSNRMDDPVLDTLFNLKPIRATREGQFIIFETHQQARLGQSAGAGPPASGGLNLGEKLRIAEVSTPAAEVAPGTTLELSVTFEKGPKFAEGLNLTLDFYHLATSSTFAIPPSSHGAQLVSWAQPLLQLPDFTAGAARRMLYTFEIPAHMPAGFYRLRFALVPDCTRPQTDGPPQTAPLTLMVTEPAPARAPLKLRPAEGFWRNQTLLTGYSWLGLRRQESLLTSGGKLWLRPALPPGVYDVIISGRGLPAGTDIQDRWPVLKIHKPFNNGKPLEDIAFDSVYSRSAAFRIQWHGPQDYLVFSIANPNLDATPSDPFALYLDDVSRGNRSIALDQIVIRNAGGASR